MLRSFVALSMIVFAAAPVPAASYFAKLAAPTRQRLIAPDISWACGADACQGSTLESRPMVLCQSLAKQAGRIDSFLVDGRSFSPAELDKCNSAVRASPAKALASQ